MSEDAPQDGTDTNLQEMRQDLSPIDTQISTNGSEIENLTRYSEEYKSCVEIDSPKFEGTAVAASSIPRELLAKLPELRDPYISVGIPETGIRNVLYFGKVVDTLQTGQRLKVQLDKLSSFRTGGGYSRWPHAQEEGKHSLKKGEFVGGGFSLNGVASTNVDTYEAVVKELGIDDAPGFKELLADGLGRPTTQQTHKIDHKADPRYVVSSEDHLGYRSKDFLTQTGLTAFFYMQGEMVGRMAPTVDYSFGVCVYSPPKDDRAQ